MDDFGPNLSVWTKLFPTFSILNLDEMSGSAIEVALHDCETKPSSYCDSFDNGNLNFNKSTVWKMTNPSQYLAVDGSLHTLALASDWSQCACADAPKKTCWPEDHGFSGLLVSCPDGAADKCKTVGPGLDPHAFHFRGHPMAFTNIGSPKVCHPKLLNLTSFELADLRLPGMSQCEKNWQPFSYGGDLFFSQWLRPSHTVLKCSVETNACEVAFNTSTNFKDKIHGSTPYVELDSDHWVAAAHVFTLRGGVFSRDEDYWHMFFAVQRQPPFAVVASTQLFQLPVADAHADAEWSRVQYAAGMMRRDDDFVLSYGVGDCIAQAVKVPVKDVAQALGL